MTAQTITRIPYRPRQLFLSYHARTERFAKIVAHRRFGKTVGTINDLIRAAARNQRTYPPPRYSFVAPTYAQAKDVAWGYLKHYTAPIRNCIVSESELYVQYPTGARVRLYGADNYERMRGVYNDDVVIDEPGQIDPRAWPEVIRPTLSDFNGRATFIGTVRGKDWFHRVDRDESDKELPSWFRLTLRASETGILPRSELDAARADMSEEQYAREYECSILAGVEGAYFSKLLAKAEQEGRITALAVDPLLPLRAYWDIGGAGAKADACCIWIVQFVGQQINVLDYCEGVGQVLAFYVNWLRKNDYERAECVLPHDGIVTNNVTGKTYESHLREAQFSTRVIPNQGPGAAAMRIEAIRRLGPKLWFNAKTTEAGRDALGFYHERRDSQRNIGLGPDHDWSSHAADAFGMMAVTYVEPASSAKFWRKLDDYRPAVTVA